jgi:hypothetical protein
MAQEKTMLLVTAHDEAVEAN